MASAYTDAVAAKLALVNAGYAAGGGKTLATSAQLKLAVQQALEAAGNNFTAADAGELVRQVINAMPALNRTTVAKGVVEGALLAGYTLNATTADFVAIAKGGNNAAYLDVTDANKTLRDLTQNTVATTVMKATLVPGQLTPVLPLSSAPSFTVANALGVAVVGDLFSNVDDNKRRAEVLNAMYLAIPVPTVAPNVFFTAADKSAAQLALASQVTSPSGGNIGAVDAGKIAGRLARTQAAAADPIARGMSQNLANASDKATFLSNAAGQGATPLIDVTKNNLAVGVSKTTSNASEQASFVVAVANTMQAGDAATTAASPLDVRRANIAAAVIKIAGNYSNAPTIVEEMLAAVPLVNPSGLWNNSLTGVTIAAKFATTIGTAIPAATALTGVSLSQRSAALSGATAGLTGQYTNNASGISVKVAVAQAVIKVNPLLVANITKAVVDEAYADTWDGSVYSGTTDEQKALFAAAIASGLTDVSKGQVAAGAALSNPSLAGKIALKVGDLNTGNVLSPSPTPTSRAAISVAVAKALKNDAGITSILQDLASTGIQSFASGANVDQATYASKMIASLTLATANFNGINPSGPISGAIADAIKADQTNALNFVGSLAALQKTSGTNIGLIVTAVAPSFDSITDLTTKVTFNAPLQAVAIATSASNYSPTNAIAIASAIVALRNATNTAPLIPITAAVGVFNATANAAAGVVGADKPLKVGQAASTVLAQFQTKAGDIATAAATGTFGGSTLSPAGKATVAGAMAAVLSGLTISTNAVTVADNFAKTVTTGDVAADKGSIAYAVIAAQPATLKAVLQKVAQETELNTVTLKANLARQIAALNSGYAGQAAAAIASMTDAQGVGATNAPTVASLVAAGRSVNSQVDIAYTVAGAVTAQATNIAKSVLNTSLGELAPAGDYLTKAANYAGVAAQYSYQFSLSGLVTINGAAPEIAGEAAKQASSGVAATNMFSLAKVFGEKLNSTYTSLKFANASAPIMARKIGTELQTHIDTNLTLDPLTEMFAAVAIAFTHNITLPTSATDSNFTHIKNVGKELATINPKAAPDILGLIISDLIDRGLILNNTGATGKLSAYVSGLKTSMTIIGMSATTLANLTATINDIFDGSNPYGTYGSVTGHETPVHNG